MHDDGVYVFPENRLKVEFIRNIWVGRNRLGITVDHDGFVAGFFGGQHPVNAGIVKLNSLSNAVRTGAQHHHFFTVRNYRLVFRLVLRYAEGGVVIRRFGGKLGGAGIHALKHALDAVILAVFVNAAFFYAQQMRNLAVGVAFLLGGEGQTWGQVFQIVLLNLFFQFHQFFHLVQKPRVNFGEILNGFERKSYFESVVNVE